MTIQEARIILATYTMPMSAYQLARYKIALVMVSGGYLRGL